MMRILSFLKTRQLSLPKPLKKTRVLICGAMLIVICIGSFQLFSGPTEPVYDGIELSDWIEGKAVAEGRAKHYEMSKVMKSVDKEALPWLAWAFPWYANQKKSGPLFERYLKFYNDHRKLQRYLPDPSTIQPSGGEYNAMTILGRIAPGTVYETGVLQDLLATAVPNDDTAARNRLRCLGNFTNHFELVVPVLISGLTNNDLRTVNTSIDQLKKFGPKVCDLLYPEALKETGHIRPFELAIKKIDPNVFKKLIEEKQNF